MIHIRVTQGADRGKEIRKRHGVLTIGRSAECDLKLRDGRVSHAHGEIFLAGSRCIYRDLNSLNGSVIRTARQNVWLGPLMPEWELHPRDEIVAGKNTDNVIKLVAISSPVISELEEDLSNLEPTVVQDIGGELEPGSDSIAPDKIVRFHNVLALRGYDPTDVIQAKRALCEAFREVFPEAAAIAFVDLLPGHVGELSREDINLETVTTSPSNRSPSFSLHVLRNARRRQGPVLFGSRAARIFPNADSIREGPMKSCMCAPLWKGSRMTGFVHLHTTDDGRPPFIPRDAQLLWLLASVASLVISNAEDARQHSTMRALASAGQIVTGLAHDAGKIIRTLGLTVDSVEKRYAQLSGDPAWQELRHDLEFIRSVARDSMARLRAENGELVLCTTPLHPIVDDALSSCRRYFLDETDTRLVRLVNACDPKDAARVNPTALAQVLVNCIKNSLDAINPPAETPANGICLEDLLAHQPRKRSGTVIVVTCDDFDEPERFVTLSVCDDGCGIPRQMLATLAQSPFLVSTKGRAGAGLGLHTVVEHVHRMNGRVRLASSTTPDNGCPSGTVISFCLPKTENQQAAGAENGLAIEAVSDYREYRLRIDRFLKEHPS